jgi:hypothetical protein
MKGKKILSNYKVKIGKSRQCSEHCQYLAGRENVSLIIAGRQEKMAERHRLSKHNVDWFDSGDKDMEWLWNGPVVTSRHWYRRAE